MKVSGFTTESRYVVACNGRRVPLSPAGEPGEVGGVRYAHADYSTSLHPTIPVHEPFVSTSSTAGTSVPLADTYYAVA